MLDAIDITNRHHHAGLHDRALIGLMVYSFAHLGAALGMKPRRGAPVESNSIKGLSLYKRARRGARVTRLLPFGSSNTSVRSTTRSPQLVK